MKGILIVLFVYFPLLSSAQYNPDARRDNIWVFGIKNITVQPLYRGQGLDFNSNPRDTFSFDHNLPIWYTNANISDPEGNLLFFSNGMTVTDRFGQIMPHGDSVSFGSLWSHMAYQNGGYCVPDGMIILPLPGQDSIYFIIHEKSAYEPGNWAEFCFLRYSAVNMKLNNGLGDLYLRNEFIIDDTLSFGGITANRHGNGRDWWIIVPGMYNNIYHRLLLNPEGLIYCGKQTIGSPGIKLGGNWGSCFSPDGSRYARLRCYMYGQNDLLLYTFNRCTGLFEEAYEGLTNWHYEDAACDIEFSPNSKLLYVIFGTIVFQFDLESNEIAASEQIVGQYDSVMIWNPNPPFFGTSAYLGPDNMIYVGGSHSKYFHIIHQPDLPGTACNFVQRSLKMPYYNIHGTIPNFPNFRLGAWIGSECDNLPPGLDEVDLTKNVRVYPNPASISVTFDLAELNLSSTASLQLYDLSGLLVSSDAIGPYQGLLQKDVSAIPPGLYFGQVICRNKCLARFRLAVAR